MIIATTTAQFKRAKERMTALKQIKKVSTLVKISSKAMRRLSLKGGASGKALGSEKGKYKALVSLAGRNTSFTLYGDVPRVIPKQTTGFTAIGVPLKDYFISLVYVDTDHVH
jgi:hypothetical protein